MKLERDELQQLFRYGFSLTGNEQDAYDLLHQAIERVMSKGIEPDKPVHYTMRVMRNQHLDQLRRRQRYPDVSLDEVPAMDLSEQVLDNQVIASVDMNRIWRVLQPEEREILYMWAVEDWTAGEIAEQTQTPRNTILSRIHRLRLKLKAKFGAHREEAS